MRPCWTPMTSEASCRTRRCSDTAGRLSSNSCARAPALRGPSASSSSNRRRTGLASVAKTTSASTATRIRRKIPTCQYFPTRWPAAAATLPPRASERLSGIADGRDAVPLHVGVEDLGLLRLAGPGAPEGEQARFVLPPFVDAHPSRIHGVRGDGEGQAAGRGACRLDDLRALGDVGVPSGRVDEEVARDDQHADVDRRRAENSPPRHATGYQGPTRSGAGARSSNQPSRWAWSARSGNACRRLASSPSTNTDGQSAT